MSRSVLAFVAQHTPSKSRVMAIVDKGFGYEIDAIATVDWPDEAIALCNMLNASDFAYEALSGLWATLPASVQANLELARSQRPERDSDDHALAGAFINTLDVPGLSKPHEDIPWAELFARTACPPGGCDRCRGCAAYAEERGDVPQTIRCGPVGSCTCVRDKLPDDEEPCECEFDVTGPRWAAATYEALSDLTGLLTKHAQGLMWGVWEPLPRMPLCLATQPPRLYVRLAEACLELCRELEHGREPVPHSAAEMMMLEVAVRYYLDNFTGADGLEIDSLEQQWEHLPKAYGDFDMHALWMLNSARTTREDWKTLAASESRHRPGTIDHIFDKLPEIATEWPRR